MGCFDFGCNVWPHVSLTFPGRWSDGGPTWDGWVDEHGPPLGERMADIGWVGSFDFFVSVVGSISSVISIGSSRLGPSSEERSLAVQFDDMQRDDG